MPRHELLPVEKDGTVSLAKLGFDAEIIVADEMEDGAWVLRPGYVLTQAELEARSESENVDAVERTEPDYCTEQWVTREYQARVFAAMGALEKMVTDTPHISTTTAFARLMPSHPIPILREALNTLLYDRKIHMTSDRRLVPVP